MLQSWLLYKMIPRVLSTLVIEVKIVVIQARTKWTSLLVFFL